MSEPFVGKLDTVVVMHRPLSSDEIVELAYPSTVKLTYFLLWKLERRYRFGALINRVWRWRWQS